MNRKALKRISLDKLMDLKVDFAFKQLFGSEQNKNITVVFLDVRCQALKQLSSTRGKSD